MSTEQIHREHNRKIKQQTEALKNASDLHKKEADKRVTASKAEAAATKTNIPSTKKSKRRDVERAVGAANKYGKDAAAQEVKAAKFAAQAADLQKKIVKVQQQEHQRAERQGKIAQRSTDQAAEAERRRVEHRINSTEAKADKALRELSAPKAEKLRILMLGASPEGDLRIGREQAKIRKAVEAAAHRDQVELDVRTSATTSDLLDGISKFRPHVVHFSGHSGDKVIGFEDDVNEHHEGVVVTADAFASACKATDSPPVLIVLNSCNSAGQADALVDRFAPFAIGMLGSVDDTDAILYATQLYAAIANGQPVHYSHLSGQAAVELAGGEHNIPYLAAAVDVDPTSARLVKQLN